MGGAGSTVCTLGSKSKLETQPQGSLQQKTPTTTENSELSLERRAPHSRHLGGQDCLHTFNAITLLTRLPGSTLLKPQTTLNSRNALQWHPPAISLFSALRTPSWVLPRNHNAILAHRDHTDWDLLSL